VDYEFRIVTHFVYDGNGNVMGLVSATAGIESARYEYELPRMRDDQVRVPGPAAPLLKACGSPETGLVGALISTYTVITTMPQLISLTQMGFVEFNLAA